MEIIYTEGEFTEFIFSKDVPGDRLRYRNALEIPPVFGHTIRIIPDYDSVSVVILSAYIDDDLINYVKTHKRKNSELCKILKLSEVQFI